MPGKGTAAWDPSPGLLASRRLEGLADPEKPAARFDAGDTVRTALNVTTLAPSPAAATGEDLVAARLFEEHGARIYRYCLARLRSREEAEDAVQSTFLRVYQALRKGQVPQCEQAWLFKIAHNVCLSRYAATRRRAGVEQTQDIDAIEYALPARDHRGDELLGLPDALGELPANLRTAILLREWQGLSYAEIADTMGTTVSAVETLICRARRRLAATLDRARTAIGLLIGLPAKLLAGGALVAATGAAGFGAAVVIGSPGSVAHAPRPRVAHTMNIAQATSVAVVPIHSRRPAPQAHAPADPVRVTPERSAPTARPPAATTTSASTTAPAATSSPPPAAAAQSPVTLPSVPATTDAALPSLPSVPDTVSSDLVPQVTVTVPALPTVSLPAG